MKSFSLFLYITFLLLVSFPTYTFAEISAVASSSSSETQSLIKQLQQQIIILQKQIKDLQVQVDSSKKEIENVRKELKLTRALFRGSTGDDVKELQQFLASQFPDLYPEGLITGYFGPKTEIAVKKLQEQQGIEAIGIVGPKTLSKLNQLITQGAGESGKVPVGLLTAPRLEEKISSTTPFIPTPLVSITTHSSTTPAIPATPALSATTTATSTILTIPITPAVPAIPAQPTTPTQTTIPSPTPSPSPSPIISPLPSPSASSSPSLSPTPSPSSTPSPDTTPPTISNIKATPNTQADPSLVIVDISWTTSEPADSEVEYGITTGYGFTNGLATSLYTNQERSVVFSSAGTASIYHYRVKSKDAAGNLATSGDQTFTITLAQPSISITSPASNSSYASGATIPITWQSTNTSSGAVVDLSYSSCPTTGCAASYWIRQSLSSTGSFAWTQNLSVGQWYLIADLRSGIGVGSYTLTNKTSLINITSATQSTTTSAIFPKNNTASLQEVLKSLSALLQQIQQFVTK